MSRYTEQELKYFDNPYKVAIIATVDEDGDIHMFNASTLMNKGDDEMMFGEFVRGKSKKLIYQHPKCGFFIMSVDQHFWTGDMDFTHSVTEGEDYVYMNQYQLFRFNTYFGVCEVHYADLHSISDMQKLNLPGVIANALKVMAMKPFFAGDKNKKVLRPWAQKFMNGLITLEFIGFMGEDGYPRIVPIIQAQAASSSRIFFTKAPYSKMLKELKDGQRCAIYGFSLDMEATHQNGVYHEGPLGTGYLEIDKIYATAPPISGEINYDKKYEPVDFHDEPLAPNWI